MKASTVGIVSAAVLMVVAGVGIGIAQAAGTHTDKPVLSFEDQEVLEQGISSSPNAEITLAGGSHLERPVLSFEDQEVREPVETGAIPVIGSEESWMKDYGDD